MIIEVEQGMRGAAAGGTSVRGPVPPLSPALGRNRRPWAVVMAMLTGRETGECWRASLSVGQDLKIRPSALAVGVWLGEGEAAHNLHPSQRTLPGWTLTHPPGVNLLLCRWRGQSSPDAKWGWWVVVDSRWSATQEVRGGLRVGLVGDGRMVYPCQMGEYPRLGTVEVVQGWPVVGVEQKGGQGA